MVRAQQYVKTSEDAYFTKLDMVVSSRLLIAGHQEFDLTRVSSCEVVAQPRKADWPRFLKNELIFTAVAAPVWAVITFLNLWNPGLLAAVWASIAIRGTLRELGEPVQYALVLNTREGPIAVVTRRDNGLQPAADEINKRIVGLPLLPEPAMPSLPQPYLQQSGEPTRRIT